MNRYLLKFGDITYELQKKRMTIESVFGEAGDIFLDIPRWNISADLRFNERTGQWRISDLNQGDGIWIAIDGEDQFSEDCTYEVNGVRLIFDSVNPSARRLRISALIKDQYGTSSKIVIDLIESAVYEFQDFADCWQEGFRPILSFIDNFVITCKSRE